MNYLNPPSYAAPAGPIQLDVTEADVWGAERYVYNDGEKYPGGFGDTKIFVNDLWLLRQRSRQLFTENLYARGLIQRLVTNEINTGLSLEATPIDELLPLTEEQAVDWSELTELRFSTWATNPRICDYAKMRNFGKLQRIIRMSALVDGDCLIVMRINRASGMPNLQIVPAGLIQTPIGYAAEEGKSIRHGVEVNDSGEHIGYWITQRDGSSKRIAARGPKSGRRLAWMYYGTDKRYDDTRGQPLLSIVLQSLKEIDRYRDAAQRKAAINAMVAMFVKKTEDKPGTKPMTGGAVRRVNVANGTTDAPNRKLKFDSFLPGLVMDELQTGEEPVVHSTAGSDINFQIFEDALVNSIAWTFEIPPEILKLAFNNNFSASRAAINEFKIYLNKARSEFSAEVTQPVYEEYLVSSVLLGEIQATGFLQSWRTPAQYTTYGAWVSADWGGAIKPSVDHQKDVTAYKGLVGEGWITNDRASKELTGTKFEKNIKRIRAENQRKADAMRPILELKQEFGEEVVEEAMAREAQKNDEMFLDADGVTILKVDEKGNVVEAGTLNVDDSET